MNLDPKVANDIVTSMKDIFHHEINFFDTSGTIVASTDKTRIGTGHEGARLVLRTHRPIVIDSESDFKGARRGINVPVMFNGDAIAVIGITGKADEVKPFGDMLGKMTEILIRESWERNAGFDRRMNIANLTSMLCSKRHDREAVDYLASALGLNFTRGRRAIVGRIPLDTRGSLVSDSLYANIAIRFRAIPRSFFSLSPQELRMFVDEDEKRNLPRMLDAIREDVKRYANDASILFGVGLPRDDADDYWKSYEEANWVLRWPRSHPDDSVRTYDKAFNEGVVLASIPAEEASEFLRHIFEGIMDAELDDFQRVFNSYTRHNGSILHSSQELFLHKNTMQNRLNKIAQRTGLNPRELSDYATLSMAFKLRDYFGRVGEKKDIHRDT